MHIDACVPPLIAWPRSVVFPHKLHNTLLQYITAASGQNVINIIHIL
jgi:hypothetical protein